ncbi:MAG TPA: hypothetical protein DCZ34_01005 [Clostridiales bacterium]|nr:hypothetical protein [Clostridiales bacterium]
MKTQQSNTLKNTLRCVFFVQKITASCILKNENKDFIIKKVKKRKKYVNLFDTKNQKWHNF